MKRTLIILAAALVLAAPAPAGVAKRTKSDVTFRGFGNLSLASSSKLTADKQWTDSVTAFKGKGLAGGLIGKSMFRSGDTGQIIDLPASTITQLEHKKKEYSVGPIGKLPAQPGAASDESGANSKDEQPSTLKVTRNEFKVVDTGESSTINNFPCRKYLATWLTEWEDTKSGEKGSSTMDTVVWTTPPTDALRTAQAEEMTFSRAYLKKMGLDIDPSQRDILGSSWMSMLDAFGRPGAKPNRDVSQAAAEMQKIKGYPIVIDGKYDMTGLKGQGAAAEAEPAEEESSKGIKGGLGGFLKKTLKKKPADTTPKAEEPMLTYRIEVLEVSTPSLGAADFQVPPDYRKKG